MLAERKICSARRGHLLARGSASGALSPARLQVAAGQIAAGPAPAALCAPVLEFNSPGPEIRLARLARQARPELDRSVQQ